MKKTYDGKWIIYEGMEESRYCSFCDMDFDNDIEAQYLFNFCPNCGSKMKDVEVWNGPKYKIVAPAGTFNKIYNDKEGDEDENTF